MNENHDTNIKGIRKGYIDVFQEFMIENAEFDGYWEIPMIKPNVYRLPNKLIAYDQRKQECLNSKEVFIHFTLMIKNLMVRMEYGMELLKILNKKEDSL